MTTIQLPSLGRTGRPRKLDFSDIFLLNPRIELELHENGISEKLGKTSPGLQKIWQDIGRHRPVSQKRAEGILYDLRNNELTQHAFEAIDRNGGIESISGKWKVALIAIFIKLGDSWPLMFPAWATYILELEEQLVAPTLAMNNGNYGECADLLEASALVSYHLWPEAITKIRNAENAINFLPERLWVTLDIQISWLACEDVEAQIEGIVSGPTIEKLFPDFNDTEILSATPIFLNWLANYSGLGKKIIEKILPLSKPACDADIETAKRQLRRWKSGEKSLSNDTLDMLLFNIFGPCPRTEEDANYESWSVFIKMVRGMHRINFITNILMFIKQNNIALSHGHTSLQDWRESRYRYWYQYWLSQPKSIFN